MAPAYDFLIFCAKHIEVTRSRLFVIHKEIGHLTYLRYWIETIFRLGFSAY